MALSTLADMLLEEGVRNAARLLTKARILSALSAKRYNRSVEVSLEELLP